MLFGVSVANQSPQKALFTSLVYTYNLMADKKQLLDEVEHDIMNYQNQGLCYLRKPSSIIVLLYILMLRNRGEAFSHSFSEGEHLQGIGNQADFELDMINAISAVDIYCIYHVKFTSYID